MICDYCGQDGARLRRLSKAYGKGDQMIVVENIPVISCTACGQSYMTAETMHKLQQIRQQHTRLTPQRSVGVLNFG